MTQQAWNWALKHQKSNIAQNRRSELPRSWFWDMLYRKTRSRWVPGPSLPQKSQFLLKTPKHVFKNEEAQQKTGFRCARSAPLTFVLKGQQKSKFYRARSAPLTFVLTSQQKSGFFRARSAPLTLNWLKNVFLDFFFGCRVTKRLDTSKARKT